MTVIQRYKSLIADQDGGMTIFMIFWMIIFIIFGGLAVDSSNAWRMRSELQATADAAAHAAIFDIKNQQVALAKANQFAEKNMPSSMHGDVLFDTDVEFGNWSQAHKLFIPQDEFDEDSPLPVNAVRTTTYRAANNNNRLPAYFLRLAGFQSWNVSAQAIAAQYHLGTCLDYYNVIMAEGQIFLNPGATYGGDLCIHSNDHIRSQPGVNWNGAYASMPDNAFNDNIWAAFEHYNPQVKLNEDGDEYTNNPGLYDSLNGNDEVEILPAEFPTQMVTSIYGGDAEYLPDGTDPDQANTFSYTVGVDELPETLVDNSQYNIDCGSLDDSVSSLAMLPGGETDHADAGGLLERLFSGLFAAHALTYDPVDGRIYIDEDTTGVVIVTDCSIQFNGGVHVGSAFVTLATDQAVHFGQAGATQIGANDECAPGGETYILAPNGDIHSSAKSSFYDAHFLGGGDFHLAAQGKGGEIGEAVGLTVKVAGSAHITALANFNGCEVGDEEESENLGYRLVQ